MSFQIQGGGKNVIEAEGKVSVFYGKLKLWQQRLENNNFANFPLFDEVVSNGSAINDEVSCNELQGLLAVFTERFEKLQRSFVVVVVVVVVVCFYLHPKETIHNN